MSARIVAEGLGLSFVRDEQAFEYQGAKCSLEALEFHPVETVEQCFPALRGKLVEVLSERPSLWIWIMKRKLEARRK